MALPTGALGSLLSPSLSMGVAVVMVTEVLLSGLGVDVAMETDPFSPLVRLVCKSHVISTLIGVKTIYFTTILLFIL